MIIAAAVVSGCSGAFNGPEQALSVAQQHPIAVDSQVVTLTIRDDASTDELSRLDKARLRAFADSYLRNGHGPLTITAPSGSSSDIHGQEVSADVRTYLNSIGVPWSSMGGSSYRSGETDGRDVIISYTHYVATPSPCGIWEGLREADRRNIRSPNFGCATQNNLAAMIADPRDLIEANTLTDPDSNIRIRGVNAFRQGEDSSSQVNDEINQTVAAQ